MPKRKITREIIMDAAFSLIRETGISAVNARNIADKVGCSVQPIYTCFSNMEELIGHLYEHAYRYYNAYVDKNSDRKRYFESIGKCHISFAKEEKHLFCFLFLSRYLRAASLSDIYRKYGRSDVMRHIQDSVGLERTKAEELYMNMIVYTHGIACLLATDAADISSDEIRQKVDFAYWSFMSELGKEKE